MVFRITLCNPLYFRTLPEDPVEKVVYMHKIYVHLLSFLKVQGACLPHILPEYLLDYEHYEIFTDYQRKRRGKEVSGAFTSIIIIYV